MKTVKREKSTSTRGHYVTNGKLLPEVIRAKGLGKVTPELAKMIWMIAERYSRKHNFVGYSFREDMVSAALMNLCNNALKFNPEKSSNPFSFYTTAIHHSFLQYMADEKKHRTIRDSLLIDAGSNPSFGFGESDDHELKDSDSISYNPAPLALGEDEPVKAPVIVDGEIVPPPPKEIKYRFECRQPGEAKVMKLGIDFIQDENGNIVYLNQE